MINAFAFNWPGSWVRERDREYKAREDFLSKADRSAAEIAEFNKHHMGWYNTYSYFKSNPVKVCFVVVAVLFDLPFALNIRADNNNSTLISQQHCPFLDDKFPGVLLSRLLDRSNSLFVMRKLFASVCMRL